MIKGDPLCQLQTSCDLCAPSLFPGPCCSSVFYPSLHTHCLSVPSPHSCPNFFAQLVPDSHLWCMSPALASSPINLFLCCWVYTDFSLPAFLAVSVALYHSSFSESSLALGVHTLYCLPHSLLPLQPLCLTRQTPSPAHNYQNWSLPLHFFIW